MFITMTVVIFASMHKTPVALTSIPWQSIQCATDSAPPSLQFDEQTGHSLELPSQPEPVHFVSNFLDHEVLGHVVEERNG